MLATAVPVLDPGLRTALERPVPDIGVLNPSS